MDILDIEYDNNTLRKEIETNLNLINQKFINECILILGQEFVSN